MLKAFEAWPDGQAGHGLHMNPLGQAIAYARAQREDLRTYTRDGELSIDNNRPERSLHAQLILINKLLLVGSDRGG